MEEVRELITAVRDLATRVDGLLSHFSSIDADYVRIRDTSVDHERRLRRIEEHLNFEPQAKVGETSALFPAIRDPSPRAPT